MELHLETPSTRQINVSWQKKKLHVDDLTNGLFERVGGWGSYVH